MFVKFAIKIIIENKLLIIKNMNSIIHTASNNRIYNPLNILAIETAGTTINLETNKKENS